MRSKKPPGHVTPLFRSRSVVHVTENPANIFVFGDLVLDHAIFVEPNEDAERVQTEKTYKVIRRVDTAGGAANYARLLAVLSRGQTFLWGVTGASAWGSFASVLRNTQVSDCAISPIVLWSHHDEALPMNTITRVIREDGRQRHHEYRFDDVGLGINEGARATAAAYLDNAESRYGGVKAIIVNDLDMDALSEPLVKQIGDFATQRQIPLFVDPKRSIAKYRNIRATAILPNLREWCSIIGEPHNAKAWRKAIHTEEGLRRIANRSIQALPNFTFQVIKADKDGAVLVVPADDDSTAYNISHVPPHPTSVTEELPYQLGCGDVLTAVLAIEYACSDQPDKSERFLEAFDVANAVVAAYREMPWHRMPRREDIARIMPASRSAGVNYTTTAPARFLPSAERVDLAPFSTDVPGLLSTYEKVRDTIRELIEFLRADEWEGVKQSAILTAEGGSGKSLLFRALPHILQAATISALDISRKADKCKTERRFQALVSREAALATSGAGTVLMIDEAFKRVGNLLKKEKGVLLLERAHADRIRFLFVDADFDAHAEDLSNSQFLGRCEVFRLPKLRRRPSDIVPIFAEGGLSLAEAEGIDEVCVSHEVLLNTIDWALTTAKTPRDVFNVGGAAVKRALAKSPARSGIHRIDVSLDHLKDTGKPRWIHQESHQGSTLFFRSDRVLRTEH